MHLTANKRKLQEDLVEEKAKRMRLQEKLNEVLSTAEKKDNSYKRLATKIVKLRRQKGARGPQKAKSFQDYSPQHQCRIRQKPCRRLPGNSIFRGPLQFDEIAEHPRDLSCS